MHNLFEKFVSSSLVLCVLLVGFSVAFQVRILVLHSEKMDEILSSCIEVEMKRGHIKCTRSVEE